MPSVLEPASWKTMQPSYTVSYEKGRGDDLGEDGAGDRDLPVNGTLSPSNDASGWFRAAKEPWAAGNSTHKHTQT